MGRLSSKLSTYWREVAYGWRATRTWADQYALLHNTIRFHVRNGFGRPGDSRNTVIIDLWIDRDRPTTLTLRPFAGDLFVLYEVLAFNAYHIASSLLLPDDVRIVVDCGANIGITSLFLAARYPRAKILSVEPHPENFALLKANVAAVPRIVPIRACVTGTSQSTVRFTTSKAAWGNSISTDSRGVLVPAITIAEVCEQNGIDKIDLLKLDIEGAEAQVLENGAFLARTEHIIVELHGDYGFQRFQHDIAPYGLVAQEGRPPDTYLVTASRRYKRATPAFSSVRPLRDATSLERPKMVDPI
jgi:FkbM family methyltransferase